MDYLQFKKNVMFCIWMVLHFSKVLTVKLFLY